MKYRWVFAALALTILITGCAVKNTPAPIAESVVEDTMHVAETPDNVEQEEVSEAEVQEQQTEEIVYVPIQIVDALGREIILETPPERVVVTGKGMLIPMDVVFAFPGAYQKVVGYAIANQGFGNFAEFADPNYTARKLFDNTIGTEEILTYDPDLVILKSYTAESIGAPLEELGIQVLYVDFETADQYVRDVTNLGKVFQDEARAQAILDYYDQTQADVQSLLSAVPEGDRQTVLFVYYSAKDGEVALKVPPLSWMQTYLVEKAGGLPVWTDVELENNWTTVGFEQIASWNPDVVFVTTYGNDIEEVVGGLKADPQWQQLPAVQDEKLYAVPVVFYPWDQPLTRWGLTLQWMANKLYPDAVQLDFDSEAKAYYDFFYAFDVDKYENVIAPRIRGDVE
ncbi:MAG: ABC transporter substrate-binding protein [Anaerolineales bacterium]|nr:ABC transporter substrate-binding protein [Anaerolineales bacterium]